MTVLGNEAARVRPSSIELILLAICLQVLFWEHNSGSFVCPLFKDGLSLLGKVVFFYQEHCFGRDTYGVNRREERDTMSDLARSAKSIP